MSKKLYEESNLQAIANAIREKNNTQNQYTPSQMPNAILQIHGEPDLETLTVTENGNYLPRANKDGFSEVAVTVPNSYTNSDEGKVVKNGSLISQTPRAAGITENGTYDTTENNSVVVNVPTGSGVVQPLSVTQNGTYNPPSGVAGYAPVTVNVSSGGGSGDEPAVYWGDEAPLSSLGNDGDIYIRSDDVYVFRDSNNKFLKAVNKDYVVTSTSQLLSTHTAAFYKTMEGPAIAIECQINNTYGYKGPILISPVADYVKYTTNLTPWGSVEVDGIVWYIGSFTNYSPSEDSPSIPTYYDFATYLGNVPGTFNSTYASALIRRFLELAAPSIYGSVYIKINGAWQLMAKELNLEALNATSNGTYVPSYGKDGFSNVTVNVSGDTDDWLNLKNHIESNGAQWIDTGYIVQDNSKFDVVYTPSTSQPSFPALFGVRDNDQGATAGRCTFFVKHGNSRGKYAWGTADKDLELPTWMFLNGKKQKIVFAKGTCSIKQEDGNAIFFDFVSTYSASATQPLYICSLNQGGADYGAGTHFRGKLYRFRIYEGNALAHEYLPWQENGVACLKDTVTSNLLYNAGTGDFVYGTDA